VAAPPPTTARRSWARWRWSIATAASAPLPTVYFETLLDENAASHIALGAGLDWAVGDEHIDRVNRSEIHIDFMIGSDEVSVTGVMADGERVAVLRGGEWQI
jgi:aminopeptidase